VVGLTLHNTNTNEALVHEQAGNDTQNEEPAESGHRTVGAWGGGGAPNPPHTGTSRFAHSANTTRPEFGGAGGTRTLTV
jgi:hypothetical protein